MEPRIDFTFSYYIFAWFLLYYCKFVQYNPFIWLLIGLSINIMSELYFIIVKKITRSFTDYVLFIGINICIKIIPIWILRNSTLRMVDFVAGIYLYILLFIWMFIHLGSIQKIIQYHLDMKNRLVEKKSTTPIIHYLHKWKFV